MDITKIQSLLNQVKEVSVMRKTRERLAAQRGENFNIFEILGLETNETALHSAFLANLLNPKGSHGLGDRPLRLFCEMVCNNYELNFTKEITIEVEYFIDKISTDYTSGGRIDILIHDGQHYIVIENKIYAEDQPNQLMRYNDFCKNKNHILLYLTLDGHQASEYSTGKGLKSNQDYFNISYCNDILKWLVRCREIAIDHPLIREVLNQYIKTIKKLTNQNTTMSEKEYLFKIMSENTDAVSEIIENATSFNYYFLHKHVIIPLENWAKENDFICSVDENLPDGKRYSGINIYKPSWNKRIRFEFEGQPFRGLISGICYREKGPKGKLLPGFKGNSDGWPYGWHVVSEYPDLNYQNFSAMKDGSVTQNLIKEINNILRIVRDNPAEYQLID